MQVKNGEERISHQDLFIPIILSTKHRLMPQDSAQDCANVSQMQEEVIAYLMYQHPGMMHTLS